MRSSLLAGSAGWILVLGLGLALASGCSLALCGRNSDCAAGEVCTAVGQCAQPPADAGADGTSDGADVTVIDNAPRKLAGPGTGNAVEPMESCDDRRR